MYEGIRKRMCTKTHVTRWERAEYTEISNSETSSKVGKHATCLRTYKNIFIRLYTYPVNSRKGKKREERQKSERGIKYNV